MYSPAAYLADLLQLVDDHFQEDALTANRPAIREIPLDATNTDTEIPYLDVVIEVLGQRMRQQLDADPDETLRTAPYPFALPFSRDDVRRRLCLRQAGVEAAALYHSSPSRWTPTSSPVSISSSRPSATTC